MEVLADQLTDWLNDRLTDSCRSLILSDLRCTERYCNDMFVILVRRVNVPQHIPPKLLTIKDVVSLPLEQRASKITRQNFLHLKLLKFVPANLKIDQTLRNCTAWLGWEIWTKGVKCFQQSASPIYPLTRILCQWKQLRVYAVKCKCSCKIHSWNWYATTCYITDECQIMQTYLLCCRLLLLIKES